MPMYNVTEHRGRRVRVRSAVGAKDPRNALQIATMPPAVMPPNIKQWRFIDDGCGGGALIDPSDEDHCIRADPRNIEDYISEDEDQWQGDT